MRQRSLPDGSILRASCFSSFAFVTAFVLCASACSSGGSSAPSQDASVDAPVVHHDAGAQSDTGSNEADDAGDALVDASDAAACVPIPTGVPTWHPPTVRANACTKTEIGDGFATCRAGGDCTLPDVTPDCRACLVGLPTDPTRAVMYELGQATYLNVPGCIAIESGDASPGGCAVAMQALNDCDAEACATCPFMDDVSQGLEACITRVNGHGTCAAEYANYGLKCKAFENHTAYKDCSLQAATTEALEAQYTYVANLLCGSGPGDASVEDGGGDDGGGQP